MDNLKTLLDQKKYDLVIKLTESSTVSNDLFYRISAFIYLGKYEEALFVIQDHQKELEKNLVPLINAHINLLCALNRFDQAYSALDYYNNLPYQSQIVEEILRKMPELISSLERKQTGAKQYDDEQVEKMLSSSKVEDVYLGLDIVKGRDIFTFLPILEMILLKHPKETVKSYTLMLLVKKEVDRELKINKKGEIISINPKKLTPPFTGEVFDKSVKGFDSEYKDLSISQTATQLFSQYCIYIYPREFKYSPEEYIVALNVISSEYMNSSDFIDYVELANSKGLEVESIESLIKEIREILDDF